MKSENNLKEKLILTGKIPFEEIPKHIAAADICLLPAYKNETMLNIVPIKIYEYMAMGKPVISTSLPGLKKEFGYDNGISYIENPNQVLEKSIFLCENNRIQLEGKKASLYLRGKDWNQITEEFENRLDNFPKKQLSVV